MVDKTIEKTPQEIIAEIRARTEAELLMWSCVSRHVDNGELKAAQNLAQIIVQSGG